jgi:biotin carboxyl carrier protein
MRRTFIANLDDREASIEVESAGGSLYRVRQGDDELLVDARRVPGGLSMLIDGENHEVSLARIADEDRARRAAARGSREMTGRREVKASMPGKVIDVLVAVGERVEAKHGLLIIEAMKMENEIKSQGPGEVKEIHVKPGQAVESGEILVVLE